MNFVYSLATGILFGFGVFMLMRRSWLKLVVGIGLLGNAVNLFVFASGGLVRGQPPIIPLGKTELASGGFYADPLPQALVLTAIVIGFGAQVFLFILLRQSFLKSKSDDLNQILEPAG